MTPSKKCEDLIKGFEQCRLQAYLPTAHDVPTIGWGSTGPDIHLGMTWTQAQADERFSHDLARFAAAVNGVVPQATQGQFDGMVSLAYNIGMGNFGHSTLVAMHNKGDHAGAANQFARWNKQAGVVLKGLVRRREAEREMYLS